jgi:hypothetical protein
MKKLRIGYWPLSSNLKSAGDRRRVVFWANSRGHEIVTDLSQKVDVLIASEKSDFNSLVFAKTKTPVIFDLIDAYLSPLNKSDDTARGLAKKLSGQISGPVKPFSRHVGDFCQRSSAVICSSIEQQSVIKPFNLNTHIILDSHDEFPFVEPSLLSLRKHSNFQVIWEGQPATIRGVRQISSVLHDLNKINSLEFNFVTDKYYFQFLGNYIKRQTSGLLKKDLKEIYNKVNIIPWSTEALIETSKRSNLAIIPTDLSIPMQNLKPENRLLIMWRLGIPCLTSPSPAYTRVAQTAKVDCTCRDEEEWFIKFSHLLSDPHLAHEEILRGQNYLLENHNGNQLLNRWDTVVQSVLG